MLFGMFQPYQGRDICPKKIRVFCWKFIIYTVYELGHFKFDQTTWSMVSTYIIRYRCGVLLYLMSAIELIIFFAVSCLAPDSGWEVVVASGFWCCSFGSDRVSHGQRLRGFVNAMILLLDAFPFSTKHRYRVMLHTNRFRMARYLISSVILLEIRIRILISSVCYSKLLYISSYLYNI